LTTCLRDELFDALPTSIGRLPAVRKGRSMIQIPVVFQLPVVFQPRTVWSTRGAEDQFVDDQQSSLSDYRLPSMCPLPMPVQAVAFAASRRWTTERLSRRYGNVFGLNLPVFGPTTIVADPVLAKEVYAADPDDLGPPVKIVNGVFGPGSVFGLNGAEHRARRRVLTPPFRGNSVRRYEQIVERETLSEISRWRENRPFSSFDAMMQITLNVILRAVFGVEGAALDELRRILPPWVSLGSRLALLPRPSRTYGRYTPWGRLAELRRQYDEVIGQVMDRAYSDPGLNERSDVLSILMCSSDADGSTMSRKQIADELLTLLVAGHETTAATLSWFFERVSRHPAVLEQLREEADGDSDEFRRATMMETQRSRPVIDFITREVRRPGFTLGPYALAPRSSIIISTSLIHDDPAVFPEPARFDPHRFLASRGPVELASWMPFGGGARRCVGANFAQMEMSVTLRTVLRHVILSPTDAPGEAFHSRGIAWTPKAGGRITVRRRSRGRLWD
jgi:cytochrome P450 family 138